MADDNNSEQAGAGWYLRVTDLKQFAYCPRIVYYSYCLPLVRPTTYKMEAGVEAHEKAAGDEARRSLRAYGLSAGERRFDVALTSERLGLSGRIDMVIVLDQSEAIPVDYKLSRHGEARHFHQQLAAYAELIEENWQIPVRRGFLYLLPERRGEEIKLTGRLRAGLRSQAAAMRAMISSQTMPEPTPSRARCVNCEYRRFCNDLF
ncbi:MAG TPA: CRISPR-associated protein Cas4 [Anaerolineae bacterium]|nr:CRISPR-associated protein Cas4 [Anaerolineae bacterium]